MGGDLNIKGVKRALLVFPVREGLKDHQFNYAFLEPLGLEYLAAGFPEGVEVRIHDMRADPRLDRALLAYRPDMVGFTSFTMHVNAVIRLADMVKRLLPGCLVIVGGPHANFRPGDFDVPSIDLAVYGEGSSAIGDLFDRASPIGVPGMAYKDGGGFAYNKPRLHPNLDGLPPPRRDLAAKDRSRHHYDFHYDITSVRTSMGCRHRCRFCTLWMMAGGRYLARDVEAVVSEIASLPQKVVYFCDDESMIDVVRMRRMAERLAELRLGKKFILWARADNVTDNRQLYRIWREAGLTMVLMGFEGCSNRELSEIDKQLTVERQLRAVNILKNLGIDTEAYFMVRHDYCVRDFSRMLRHIRAFHFKTIPGLGVMTPLPGSILFNEVKHGKTDWEWEMFDWTQPVLPTRLPPDQFRRLYLRVQRDSSPFLVKLLEVLKYPPAKVVRRLWLALADRLIKLWVFLGIGGRLASAFQRRRAP